jgi:hypothetical protein
MFRPARSIIGSSSQVKVECSSRMCSASSARVHPSSGSVAVYCPMAASTGVILPRTRDWHDV